MDWSERLFLALCFGPIVIALIISNIKPIAIILGATFIGLASYFILRRK